MNSRKSKKFQGIRIELLEGRIPPASMMTTGLENAAERVEMNMTRMDRDNTGLENAAGRIEANQERMADKDHDKDEHDEHDEDKKNKAGGQHGGGHKK